MLEAPIPKNERERLRAVNCLEVPPESLPDPDLQNLAEVAALVCGTSMSLITLVGKDKQRFRAQVGLEGLHETPREISFCGHTILQNKLLEIPDTHLDWRFATNPLVTGFPNMRFYAGAPLITSDGLNVGALCVMDVKPMHLTEDQRRVLLHLAEVASHVLEATRAATEHSRVAAELKALHDSAPFGLSASDANGQSTRVNAKWREIYGLGASDSLGDGWMRHLDPEDRARVTEEWARAVAGGLDFDQEFRVLRADGSRRIVRSVARAMRAVTGELVGFSGSDEDVTTSREQAQLIEDRRQRLGLIIEATGVSTAEWNLQTGEVRLSPQWTALTGHAPDDSASADAASMSEAVHPEDLARMEQAVGAIGLSKPSTFDIELRMHHKLGHWIWVFARFTVVTYTAGGKPEWIFSSAIDITERKKADERLRQSELLLSKTGEAAGVGGWEYDLETRELTWTDELRRIRGVPPGFTPPDFYSALDVYAPDSKVKIVAGIEAAQTSGTAFDLELQLKRPDGTMIWVRAICSAEMAYGKPVRLFGATQDISERVARQKELVAEHQRMVLATESSEIGVWEKDVETGKATWDRQTFRLFGYDTTRPLPPESEVWLQAVHPDDQERVESEVVMSLSENSRCKSEFRVIWHDGSVHYIKSLADVVIDPRSDRKILLGVNWDVTKLRKLSQDLAAQHERMRVTLRSIADAVITTDSQDVVTWLNPVAEAMTGWAMQDAIGQPIRTVFDLLREARPEPAQNGSAGGSAPAAPGTILMSRTGHRYAIEDSAAPIRDDNDHVQGAVVVFRDVTVERRLRSEMAYRATHDGLTGIQNRSEFEIRLQQIRLRAQNLDGVHALLYIDLDHFKLINDSCGHLAGDEVLQQVSRILKDSVRAEDVVARVGGDEFAILLEYCQPDRAAAIAQQICDQMEVYRYSHEDRRFRIGASIGVVSIGHSWKTSEAIVQAADAACLMAKEAGRNRVRVWECLDSSLANHRNEVGWAAQLEQALDDNLFQLFVQEIRSLDTSPCGLCGEILLRIKEPGGTFLLPGQFLPAAERFNLVSRIDRWVLREAIRVVGENPDMARISFLSLNISGHSLADRDFHLDALAALSAAGPDFCSRLFIEITETAAVDNLSNASLFIEQLHALGVRVALDDFGAGTASFGYLRALKVDWLKIDGQFIQGLIDDPISQATVECFTAVAKILKISTVAEYVDRAELLDLLTEMGVNFAQGNLIATPVAIEDFLAKAQAAAA